jgi:hypothetical protein
MDNLWYIDLPSTHRTPKRKAWWVQEDEAGLDRGSKRTSTRIQKASKLQLGFFSSNSVLYGCMDMAVVRSSLVILLMEVLDAVNSYIYIGALFFLLYIVGRMIQFKSIEGVLDFHEKTVNRALTSIFRYNPELDAGSCIAVELLCMLILWPIFLVIILIVLFNS